MTQVRSYGKGQRSKCVFSAKISGANRLGQQTEGPRSYVDHVFGTWTQLGCGMEGAMKGWRQGESW